MPIMLTDGTFALSSDEIAEELNKIYTERVRIQPVIGTDSGYILHKDNKIVSKFQGPGLYSIWKDDICLYVGASGNVASRLSRFVKSVRGFLRQDEGHTFGTGYRERHGESFDQLKIVVYPYDKPMVELVDIENSMMRVLNSLDNKRRNR